MSAASYEDFKAWIQLQCGRSGAPSSKRVFAMMPFLHLVLGWPGRLLHWLQEPEAKLTYKFVLPIVVTFGICWLALGTWEARIRWTGPSSNYSAC